jgi:hypothetical protein
MEFEAFSAAFLDGLEAAEAAKLLLMVLCTRSIATIFLSA